MKGDPTTFRGQQAKTDLLKRILKQYPEQPKRDRVPVLVSWSHKGGVGKTTSQRIIGETLANHFLPTVKWPNDRPKRILIIDMDTQGNTSSRYLKMRDNVHHAAEDHDFREAPPNFYPRYLDDNASPDCKGEPVDREEAIECISTICDLFFEKALPIPYQTANPYIDVLPSTGRLSDLAVIQDKDKRALISEQLHRFLQSKYIKDNYALVQIDTPPAVSFISELPLRVATHVYVPMEPNKQSIDGLNSAYKKLSRIQASRPPDHPLESIMVIPAKYLRHIVEHKAHILDQEDKPWADLILNYRKFKPNMRQANSREPHDPVGFQAMTVWQQNDSNYRKDKMLTPKDATIGMREAFMTVCYIAYQLGFDQYKRRG